MLLFTAVLTLGWTGPFLHGTAHAAMTKRTQLYLVSMGNGDPDNITLRAVNTVNASDIIFCGKRMVEKFPVLLHGKEIHESGFGIAAALGKDREDYKNCDRKPNYERAMQLLPCLRTSKK